MVKKTLALLVIFALVLSLGAYAASGEASGETTPVAAVIDVSAGGITVAEGTVGTVSGETAEGVLIESDELYLRGINVSAGKLTLGGDEGHYAIRLDDKGVPTAVAGEDWNSVIILDDPAHESDKLYGDGARENSLGSGIYTTGADSVLTLDNAYVWTSGAVRSALAVNSLSTVVVKDSHLESTGAITCYKPVTRLLLSTCRSNVIVGGTAYYYNSTSISGDWGALSTDTGGPNPTYLYAYNVTTDNALGGYTTYADTNCYVEIYGSDMVSAEYGGFIACSGVLRIGSLAEASEAALLYAEEDDLLDEDKPSVITAGRNDIVVHLVDSMGRNSGYNRMAGVLDISTTNLKTDKAELTPRDYYNDENGDAYGESGYFLDYTAGSAIVLRSTNIDMDLRNVSFDNYPNSITGRPIAIHSVLNYDARGAVSVPDGDASLNHEIDIAESVVDGDIVHMDYQRAMNIRLSGTTLNGAVVSGTTAGWNDLWADVDDNGRAENFDAEMIYSLLTKNESYETVWGANLSLDESSVWNVTGDSSLASLTLAEGAVLAAPAGGAMTIYVDVAMDNDDLSYDASTGKVVEALEPGITYTGVVIDVNEGAASEEVAEEPSGEASGEASAEPMGPPPGGGGGSMSREIPEDVAELPTIEAEYWLTTTEDRVGMEGPVFDDEGNLFVCSVGMTYPINYILKVAADKTITTVWEGALSPLGLAFHENGKLFAVCREGELLIMDKDGTNVQSITPGYEGKTFSLNDLCFTPDGDLIITDWQGTEADPIGGIYVLTAESGYQETLVLADKLPGPNGVSLSPDGQTLWVGMTNQDAIYRVDLAYAGGNVTAETVALIYQNSGAGNPDSNEVDAAGNLYQAMIQGGRVLVLNSEGEPVANVIIPEREQGKRMMSSNLAIKPGTKEAYLMTAGFGEGSHIYIFETLG